MNPRIETLPPQKLVGLQTNMSLADDKTVWLWQTFMPRRGEIVNRIGSHFINMQVYGEDLNFETFNAHTVFQKWASVPVSSFENLPAGMEGYDLRGGLYAVFLHKGRPQAFAKTFEAIFKDWLPRSPYTLDAREHFEILGDKYKRDSDDSEEEVWIPIKPKTE
jgi:AraC family transcriptional regulator